ncbi:MAG: hypothetical protein KDJ37_11715 [Hyphomicrobiaceae bacterium]|nr:hypothetical protein [Hyphomicrobiaceae bacterium]
MNKLHRRLAAIVAVVAALLTTAPNAMAQPGPASAQPATPATRPADIIVLMDASGSMWGALGSEPLAKHIVARQALDRILPALAGQHRIGLTSFGPGCRSIDRLVPLAENEAAAITAPLDRFNPRGKGPLTAGVTAAAESLDRGAPASVIVIHDGLDNCGEDVCAAAAKLAASHPRLKVHIVSLGLASAEATAISCLPRATGGTAFTVADAAGIDRALTAIVNSVAIRDDRRRGGEEVSQAPKQNTRRVAGPPRLVATAVLAPGKLELTVPLHWRVFDVTSGKAISEATTAKLIVASPPRKVRVLARVGLIEASAEIEIAEAGDTTVALSLDAGVARLDTGVKRLASDAEEPLIRLERLTGGDAAPAADSQSKGLAQPTAAPLWIARGKAIEAILPVGRYRAIAEYGLANSEARFDVAAGSEASIPLLLDAGRLELSSGDEIAARAVTFAIEVDDPTQPGGRREIARSAHPSPAFVVTTGVYYVTAAAGGASVRRLVTVRGGEVTRETFPLASGTLLISASRDGRVLEDDGTVSVSLAAVGTAPALGPDVRPILGRPFELRPGGYVVELRRGGFAISERRTVNIVAGRRESVTLAVATAELTIATDTRNAPVALCEVRRTSGAGSARGDVLLRTVANRPTATLAPGAYRIGCVAGTVTRDVAVTLAPGERRTVNPFAE